MINAIATNVNEVSLLNTSGPNSYPIASFTHLLLAKSSHLDLRTNPDLDQTKTKALF